jgi:molybdopterin converting factor small subunit
MNITVNYCGQIGQAIKLDREEIECASSIPLVNLLNDLADRHGETFRHLIFDDADQVRSSLLITINDSAVSLSSPPTLQERDELTLLPPIAGG